MANAETNTCTENKKIPMNDETTMSIAEREAVM